MRFILEFHQNEKLVKGLNCTFIALILQVDEHPQGLSEFRAISLIGCMYKMLSKVLANRLHKVINNVISDSQSVFIKEAYFFY